MNMTDSIKTTPVPTTDKESGFALLRERQQKLHKLFRKIMAIYLDDLLLVAGCVCFVSGADIKWGTAEALGVCGACLVTYAVIVARGGIGKR